MNRRLNGFLRCFNNRIWDWRQRTLTISSLHSFNRKYFDENGRININSSRRHITKMKKKTCIFPIKIRPMLEPWFGSQKVCGNLICHNGSPNYCCFWMNEHSTLICLYDTPMLFPAHKHTNIIFERRKKTRKDYYVFT